MSQPIQLKVLLFAGISERAGCREITVLFDTAPNAQTLLDRLADELPNAADLVRVSRVAVEDAFVGDDFLLDQTNADIALIPPVSGG